MCPLSNEADTSLVILFSLSLGAIPLATANPVNFDLDTRAPGVANFDLDTRAPAGADFDLETRAPAGVIKSSKKYVFVCTEEAFAKKCKAASFNIQCTTEGAFNNDPTTNTEDQKLLAECKTKSKCSCEMKTH